MSRKTLQPQNKAASTHSLFRKVPSRQNTSAAGTTISRKPPPMAPAMALKRASAKVSGERLPSTRSIRPSTNRRVDGIQPHHQGPAVVPVSRCTRASSGWRIRSTGSKLLFFSR